MIRRVGLLAVIVLILSPLAFNSDGVLQPQRSSAMPKFAAGRVVATRTSNELKAARMWLQGEALKGNLKLARVQTENQTGYVHKRYDVFHLGVRVWGAQIIDHQKDGRTYAINGQAFEDILVSVVPQIEASDAVRQAGESVGPGFAPIGTPELVLLPLEAGFLLTYRVEHFRTDALMISFVDARTGAVVFSYDDVKKDQAVGIGRGIFGDVKKLSTEYKDNTYRFVDVMRPAKIITGDMRHSEDITTTNYITDDDNDWPDPVSVDAHGYLGWIYDYFSMVHGRKGMDDANMQTVVNVHYGTNYKNAFFHGTTKWLYFGDGDPNSMYPYAGALDIVCHEFTHGITDHTCGLIYFGESGSLNEAISDILGVSCEFFHQPAGIGYQRAEWWEGEDTRRPFQAARDLSDPARLVFYEPYGWKYPDHWSDYYDFTPYGNWDNNGVHVNQAIATHWYYLLANGGTNKTSGITVSGIGVGDAERIAYRGWFYYLIPSSTFRNARSATYQAAVDLFGAGSTQAQRVARAWDAVGVY
jgi:Zn-dependent metalloprotease